MDYERIYNDLILHRQTNALISGYIERHHIIPTSLGGSDDKSNLVALTGREHYIAHLLLARFDRCSQTALALWMMQMKGSSINSDRPCIKSGRMYEWVRKECAKYTSRNNKITQKGERNSQFGKQWISNIELKESIRIDKTLPIPLGYIKGRNAWNSINKKLLKKQHKDIRSNNKISSDIIEATMIAQLWKSLILSDMSIHKFHKENNIQIELRVLFKKFKKYISSDEYTRYTYLTKNKINRE